MKIEITKERYFKIKSNEGLYNEKELLKAVVAMIRSHFNITDEQLNEDGYM